MSAVLFSIRPQPCKRIANHKKKAELRKGWLKQLEGKKCYIYCTKSKPYLNRHNGFFYLEERDFLGGRGMGLYQRLSGKVIGEFICDKVVCYTAEFVDEKKHGKCYEDIRRVWFDEDGEQEEWIVTSNDSGNPSDCDLCRDTCLSYEEIKAYIGENFHDKKFCTLHITNLVLYAKPKELSEFTGLRKTKFGYEPIKITRPPQSWCYVEEIDNEQRTTSL